MCHHSRRNLSDERRWFGSGIGGLEESATKLPLKEIGGVAERPRIVYAYHSLPGDVFGDGKQSAGEAFFPLGVRFPLALRESFAQGVERRGDEHGEKVGVEKRGFIEGRSGTVDEHGDAAFERVERTDGNAVPAAVGGPVQGKAARGGKMLEAFVTDGNVPLAFRGGRSGNVAPGSRERQAAKASLHFPDETVLARAGRSHDIDESSAHGVFALNGRHDRREGGPQWPGKHGRSVQP